MMVRVYHKTKNLIAKVSRYYLSQGMRKTSERAYFELTKKWRQNNVVAYLPELSQAKTLPEKIRVKKISFLIGLPTGESKVYRVFNIIEGLTKKGIECQTFYDGINSANLERVLNCDLLIIFRAEMSPRLDAIINKFKQQNIPIVFDIDDLMFEPESLCYIDAIQGYSQYAKAEHLDRIRKYRQALEKSDFVTCTTEFLAARSRKIGKQSFVIPNTINEAQYRLAEATYGKTDKQNKKIRIGYFSGTNTHNKDFQEAAGALFEILKRSKFTELHILGLLNLPQELRQFNSRIIRKPLMPHSEMLKYLSKIDINLAPLEQDNPFTAGKSELKIFESALFGVPSVASRTDSYSQCIHDGVNGFLAGSRTEWLEKLSRLTEDNSFRTKMGIQAKEDFTRAFYIEYRIDDVIRVYERIVDSWHQQNMPN